MSILKKKKIFILCNKSITRVPHVFEWNWKLFAIQIDVDSYVWDTAGPQKLRAPAQHNYLHVGIVTVRYCSNRHDGLRRYAMQFHGCNRNGCTSGNRVVFAAHCCLYDLPRGGVLCTSQKPQTTNFADLVMIKPVLNPSSGTRIPLV